MKKVLLIAFILLACLKAHAQNPPAPNGCNVFFVIDADNDGVAQFNIQWYLDNSAMPLAETAANADLSGYTPYMYPSEADYGAHTNVITGPIYSNITNPQHCYVDYVYNGNGPVFTNNGFFMLEHLACEILEAIPFDGDYDNDGISNIDEDNNGNGILNDDHTFGDYLDFMNPDDDGDGVPTIEEDYDGNGNPLDDDTNNKGIPDCREAAVALYVSVYNAAAFTLFPNPSNGTVNIDFGNTPKANTTLFICDVTGKQVMIFSGLSQTLNVSGLQTGIYVLKLQSERNTIIKKLLVL
jgi:hypothetical protein